MAAQTAVTAQHATLSGTTADSVTFSATGKKAVRVTNKDASVALYFNVSTATVPTSAADDTYYVAPGTSVQLKFKGDINLVRVVGNGNAYAVEISDVELVASGAGGGSGGGAVTNAGTFAVQESQVVAEDAAAANGDKLFPVGVVRRDSAASSSTTDGDYSTLNVDSTGRLWANVSNTVTVAGAVTNAGTFATQDSQVVADDAAFTPGTTKVFPVGFEADETGTDSVDEGDAGAARMTLDRKQITTPQPHTAGGLSVFGATSADGQTALTSTAQAAKASAGQVYGWTIYNPNSTAQFVQFYDVAQGSVTVGTTAPLFMLTIPATGAAHVFSEHGIAFATAVSIAATSTAGGNGAPTTALDVTVFFK